MFSKWLKKQSNKLIFFKNPKIMNDDQINMKDIKYSSENEDMTIIENNFSN